MFDMNSPDTICPPDISETPDRQIFDRQKCHQKHRHNSSPFKLKRKVTYSKPSIFRLILCLPRFRMSPMKGNSIFKPVCNQKNKPPFSSNTSSPVIPQVSKSSTHWLPSFPMKTACLNIQSWPTSPKKISLTWTGANSRADRPRLAALYCSRARMQWVRGDWTNSPLNADGPAEASPSNGLDWTDFWGGIGYPGP